MQIFNNVQMNGWSCFPQTRCSSFYGVESTFCLDGVKLIKNIQILGWVVLYQTRPSSFHGVEKPFRLDVMQPFQKHSSWWLGRVPQHPLSRPSSFHGVKHGCRFDVMQTFNNVQTNGWSCSPKHAPTHFTVLMQLFVRLLWNFLKAFNCIARPCFSKHGQVPFTVLKNLFVWMLCNHFENIQVDGWAASQHPLSQHSSFRGVEESLCLDVMQTINNV